MYEQSLLSVKSNVFRGNLLSPSVYKVGYSSGSLSQNIKWKFGSVSGRLADCKSKQEAFNSRSTEMCESNCFTRICHKRRKIFSSAISVSNLSRGVISARQGFSASDTGKG